MIEAENRGLAAGWNLGHARDREPLRAAPERGRLARRRRARRASSTFADARPRAAVVGPRLSNPDGTLQRSVRGFPTLWRLATEYFFLRKLAPRSSALNAFYAGGFDHDEVREVEFVMGACMLVRREAIDEVGAADEAFFLFSEETDWCYRFRAAGLAGRLLPGSGVRARARRLARRAPLPREPARAPAVPLEAPRRAAGGPRAAPAPRRAAAARRCSSAASAARPYREAAAWLASGDVAALLARAVSNIRLYLRLRAGDRGRARARLGARAGARRAEHVGHARVVAHAPLRRARRHVRSELARRSLASCSRSRRSRRLASGSAPAGRARSARPWRWLAASAARAVGILLWSVTGSGAGRRPLPPRAGPEARRARRALARGRRRVRGREPASRLRVPALARVPRARRADRRHRLRSRSSSTCRRSSPPIAVLVAYEAGWALFRQRLGGRRRGGRLRSRSSCFAPGSGGAYPLLSLPATSSRQLLVPAALALALTAIRTHTPALSSRRPPPRASCSRSSTRRTRSSSGSPSRVPRSSACSGRDRTCGPGLAALGALAVPAALFMLWLIPIAADTVSVSPGAGGGARARSSSTAGSSTSVSRRATASRPRCSRGAARSRSRRCC